MTQTSTKIIRAITLLPMLADVFEYVTYLIVTVSLADIFISQYDAYL